MGDKQPKAKPVTNSFLPKAGPKSNNGGRNQRRSNISARNEPDLFTRRRNDQIDERKRQREEAKAKADAKNLAFREAQAEIAKSLLGSSSGPTLDVALLVINNFVVVTPRQNTNKFYEPGTENEIKRTAYAELLILDQLTEHQLKNQSAVRNGRFIAKKVLLKAFDQLTEANKASVPMPHAAQLTNA